MRYGERNNNDNASQSLKSLQCNQEKKRTTKNRIKQQAYYFKAFSAATCSFCLMLEAESE